MLYTMKTKQTYTSEIRIKRNLLNQNFNVDAPNRVWVGDITQFWWDGKRFYICVVLDLFSRKIVAYKVSKNCSSKLVKRGRKYNMQKYICSQAANTDLR